MYFFVRRQNLDDGAADRREICLTVEQRPGSVSSPFGGSPNAGSKKGFGWTIFGLSDTDFYHSTANISKTVSRSVINQDLTSARWKLSQNV